MYKLEKMKNLLLLMILTISLPVSAQFNRNAIELGVGAVKHVSALETSDSGLHVNILYRYNITHRFGVGALGSFDKLVNNHAECSYNTSAWNITPEIFYRFLRYKNVAVIGHTGVGYSRLGQENVLNYVAGATFLTRLKDWGAIKTGYTATSYVYQSANLDNTTPISSNGINSYSNQLYAGLVFYFGGNYKNAADWYDKKPIFKTVTQEKETVIREIVNNTVGSKKIYVPHLFVFHKEGKTNIDKDGLNEIMVAYDFLLLNPEYNVAIISSSCGGKGTPQRNLELSNQRAETVANKLNSMGISKERISHRGTGVDTVFEHRDQDLQKRSEILMYKPK